MYYKRFLPHTVAFVLLAICSVLTALGQQPKLWHGIKRELRYHPDGTDFVIRNGTRRFNRAIYGTNTAFRVEAGDLPEFALYLPGMGGNFKLALVKGTESKWLINAKNIEARYRPGSMIYHITDPLLGVGRLDVTVLAGASAESMIVKASFINTDKNLKLLWVYGGATGKKFSRDGDIGADPESSFYLQPDYCLNNSFSIGKTSFILNYNAKSVSEADRYEVDHTGKKEKTETIAKDRLTGIFPQSEEVKTADATKQGTPLELWTSKASDKPVIAGMLSPKAELYWLIQKGSVSTDTVNTKKMFGQAEQKRQTLAGRVVVRTPDPYINTLGGALSVAADAIWENPSYMHGAVAWRMRLPAWRGPYVADPLGWHDRAWTHFSSYALSQMTTPESGPVIADTALHLARQLEKLGTSMFSAGYIARNPGGDIKPHHYDMNLVYIDELLNHFQWTGDLNEVKQLWPVIKRHLAWEKRNYDQDGDGLYDAYCCIWASDALQYSGGGVTHSSAYNYRANKMAAYLAKLVGDDPKPYLQEADKILKAIQSQLWLPRSGSFAEYKDLLGLKLVHPAAGLWTIYHSMDSDVPDAFQAYQSLRYIDTQIPHIPVIANGLTGNYYLLSTTNWLPYTWSLNNVAMAESLHTSLAYWQGNRTEDAFTIWKSALIESMYLGASPGNFQQLSFYDAQRGELYRDFGDPIGMAARSLVEGLFGIKPDVLKDTLTIKPGLPPAWNYASLKVPDITVDFKRAGNADTYTISTAFKKMLHLKLLLNARTDAVKSILINGKATKWHVLAEAVGQPMIQVDCAPTRNYRVQIVWEGNKIETADKADDVFVGQASDIALGKARVVKSFDPQRTVIFSASTSKPGYMPVRAGEHTFFVKLQQGQLSWWQPVNINVHQPVELQAALDQPIDQLKFKLKNSGIDEQITVTINPELKEPYTTRLSVKKGAWSEDVQIPSAYLVPGSNHVQIVTDHKYKIDTILTNWNVAGKKLNCETINLSAYFNDDLNNIFKNKYLSPRPQSPTLQLPVQGIGNWCYPLATANIDDSGLRKTAGNKGMFVLSSQQIPFLTPGHSGKNIVFTSQWDNYPKQIEVPVTGSASHAYLLMAGSTDPMQSRMVNGEVIVNYTDGTHDVLQLKNPQNWWPVEQDYDNDGFAFSSDAPVPLRVYLKNGNVAQGLDRYITIKGFSNKGIDGGAATVLDLPLNPAKQLRSFQVKTLTNDVIIGLASITLVRNL